MQNLRNLRNYLLKTLDIEPENISVFCENGTIINYSDRENDPNCNDNFIVKYDGIVLILDFTHPPELLFHVLNQWSNKNYPGHKPELIKFKSVILDHNSVDLEITIHSLQDTYRPNKTDDGTYIVSCTNQPTMPIISSTVTNIENHHVRA
ncbi:phage tail protein [Dichelobacter nodosus]|uniref:phage tail protein n=1 Tax=Dichelobacter nodosus TaxID=870 RepID=UPI00067FA2F0|nr:phage tail protein [Dichelobacter nodosus]KNZ39962.1 hypothetical protein AKG33_01040 [Dichelobacter nodosus]